MVLILIYNVAIETRRAVFVSTKKCQKGATSKHAQISRIFSPHSLLVKWNKGSLVEQHIFNKNIFPM